MNSPRPKADLPISPVAEQDEGYLRRDMPAGLAMVVTGALIRFWLHSQTEIGAALAATGDAVPADDAFIEIVLDLVRARPRTSTRVKKAGGKRR